MLSMCRVVRLQKAVSGYSLPASTAGPQLHLVGCRCAFLCPVRNCYARTRSAYTSWVDYSSYSIGKFALCVRDCLESPLNFTHTGIGGDLVEEVQLIDNFTNPKMQRTSNCYRITYRSMERSLKDEEVNKLQDAVRQRVSEQLKVELR